MKRDLFILVHDFNLFHSKEKGGREELDKKGIPIDFQIEQKHSESVYLKTYVCERTLPSNVSSSCSSTLKDDRVIKI